MTSDPKSLGDPKDYQICSCQPLLQYFTNFKIIIIINSLPPYLNYQTLARIKLSHLEFENREDFKIFNVQLFTRSFEI